MKMDYLEEHWAQRAALSSPEAPLAVPPPEHSSGPASTWALPAFLWASAEGPALSTSSTAERGGP